jgi:hypothetical protein
MPIRPPVFRGSGQHVDERARKRAFDKTRTRRSCAVPTGLRSERAFWNVARCVLNQAAESWRPRSTT